MRLPASTAPITKNLALPQNRFAKLDVSSCVFTNINRSTLKTAEKGRLLYLSALNLKQCSEFDISHIQSLEEAYAAGTFRTVKIGKKLNRFQLSSFRMTAINAKNLKVPSGSRISSFTLDLAKLKTASLSHIKNLISLSFVQFQPSPPHTVQPLDLSGCRKLGICSLNGYPLKKLIISRKVNNKSFRLEAEACGAKLILR